MLCITHLPQIAALATAHFRIEKSAETDTALTTVEALEGDGVVAELCRMLGAEASDTAAPASRRGAARGGVRAGVVRRAGEYTRLPRDLMPQSRPETRFIFITGGVVSALGKGIAAASLAGCWSRAGCP